jgi:DNA polymerase V
MQASSYMKIIQAPNTLAEPPGVISVSLNPTKLLLPVYSGRVAAGQSRWASAAQDYLDNDEGSLDGRLDLNTRYIKNPPSTFLMPVIGDSMIAAGILPGSMLVIDKSIIPRSNSVVVVWREIEYIVKRLYIDEPMAMLLSEHPDPEKYPPILYNDDEVLIVWGVVRNAINTY